MNLVFVFFNYLIAFTLCVCVGGGGRGVVIVWVMKLLDAEVMSG